jgi:hypothetical protein
MEAARASAAGERMPGLLGGRAEDRREDIHVCRTETRSGEGEEKVVDVGAIVRIGGTAAGAWCGGRGRTDLAAPRWTSRWRPAARQGTTHRWARGGTSACRTPSRRLRGHRGWACCSGSVPARGGARAGEALDERHEVPQLGVWITFGEAS